jgi:hypothetical protein
VIFGEKVYRLAGPEAKTSAPPPRPPPTHSGASWNKYFQAPGHGLARPRGVAAGQRLFIAVSDPGPEAVIRDGGWSFLCSPVWPAQGPAGPPKAFRVGSWARSATFLKHLVLEITETDFRHHPEVWNRSAAEGASRGAGRDRAGRPAQVTGSSASATEDCGAPAPVLRLKDQRWRSPQSKGTGNRGDLRGAGVGASCSPLTSAFTTPAHVNPSPTKAAQGEERRGATCPPFCGSADIRAGSWAPPGNHSAPPFLNWSPSSLSFLPCKTILQLDVHTPQHSEK